MARSAAVRVAPPVAAAPTVETDRRASVLTKRRKQAVEAAGANQSVGGGHPFGRGEPGRDGRAFGSGCTGARDDTHDEERDAARHRDVRPHPRKNGHPSRFLKPNCRGMRRSGMLDNGWVSVMPHAMIARAALRPTRIRGRRARRSASRLARRAFLAMRVAPLAVQIIVGTVLLVIVWAAVNWIVQVVRKPTEVFVRGQRLACQGAGADVAAIRPALRRALHGGHHTGIAGRSGPSGEQRQPGRTDLLAVAVQLEPVRAIRTGLERRRDVSDHRWNVRRGPALLHPRSRRRRGRALARPALVLVQRALHTCGARSCCGDDRRAAGSHGRAHPRPQPHYDRLAAAAAKPRGDHPPVRRRRR